MELDDPFGSEATVLVLGAGRVATAAATLLQRSGFKVAGVWSRTPESAARASDLLAAPLVDVDSPLPPADVALIGASDDALEPLAERIAVSLQSPTLACHFAGSMGVGPLQVLAGRTGGVGAIHPVQACPSIDIAIRRLPGSAWGITSSPGAEARCDALVARMGGTPVHVEEEFRPVWHAAAVATSNGIAAVIGVGEALLARIGIEQPQEVLGPIAQGTVANAREGGGGAATLTGPVVRGEAATIERHLVALDNYAPELVSNYSDVATAIVGAAVQGGRLSGVDASKILKLLSK